MPNFEELSNRCEEFAKSLSPLIRQGKKLLVVTHIDADGISSGAIVFKALVRKGANATVRSIADLDAKTISELAAEGRDFYIFTDLGSTLVVELTSAFDGRFVIVDHHQLPEANMKSPPVINAWQYDYDGGKEASSSTMAYFLARAMDDANRDLSHLAVVGAVGDRQDSGEGRALTGLNRRALEEAQSAGLVTVSKDLLLNGRETRPIHESIALTSTPLIAGLSNNKDGALAALVRAGFKLKDEGRWRTLTELSPEEKMKLTDLLASFLAPTASGTAVISQLFGEAYTLTNEDSFTPLRDAREFATFLNSCGRMDAAGVGLTICIGERGDSLKEGMKLLQEYRGKLSKSLQALLAEPQRMEVRNDLVLVTGDDLVDERLLGPVASILASTQQYKGKVIVAQTKSGDSELKFSCRAGDSYSGTVNLGLVMRDAAQAVGAVGGGHAMAAGAKVPSSRGQEFTRLVTESILS